MDDNVVGKINLGRRQTGLAAVQLLLLSLARHALPDVGVTFHRSGVPRVDASSGGAVDDLRAGIRRSGGQGCRPSLLRSSPPSPPPFPQSPRQLDRPPRWYGDTRRGNRT